MLCISSNRLALLTERLETKTAQLVKLYDAFDRRINPAESYKFDSGEGSQQLKYLSLKDMQDAIDRLEKEIDALGRKLNGTGIVNMNLRRKSYPYNRTL